MIDNIKACILTAYAPNTSHGINIDGTPYKRGQERLIESLKYHGFRYDILAFQDWPKMKYDTSCGYNIKAAAFDEAIKQGYERILWLDSSVWAIKKVEPLFDYIDQTGWYFYSNGFTVRQTSDDQSLAYFGMSADEAAEVGDISSSMFGLHMGNPKAQQFLEKWLQSARDGRWATSRQHNSGSQDPRYLFDRQDQTCASILRHQLDMKMEPRNRFSAIADDDLLTMKGYQDAIQKVDNLMDRRQYEEARKIIRTIATNINTVKDVILVMRGL